MERQIDSRVGFLLLGFSLGCPAEVRQSPPGGPGDSAADSAAPDDSAPDTADTAEDTGEPTTGVIQNAGDITPTLTFDTTYDYPSPAAVVDLDGDHLDELVLLWSWGGTAVLRLNVHTGTAEMGWLEDEYRAVWSMGNGQLGVKDDDGYAVLSLDETSEGWAVAERIDVGTIRCALPTGDLDGDGVADVLVQSESEVLRVVRGPVAGGFDELAQLSGWSQRLALNCGASSGDVDGDGHDDLVWLESGDNTLRVAFGPVKAGEFTVDSFPDLVLDVGQTVGDARAVVADDLDGDGSREVVVLTTVEMLGFDGLRRDTTALTPEWTLASEGMWGASGGGRVLALAGYEEVGWWYGPPDATELRPPATTRIGYYNTAVAGRFGGAAPVDVAWVSRSWVYGVPGTAAPAGSDLDRDGTAAPTDCDDADGNVRPLAPELPDGLDNDCDGEIDESVPAEPSLLAELAGGRNAYVGASGLVGWPTAAGTRAVFTTSTEEHLVTSSLIDSDATALAVGGRVSALSQAGDLNADGHEDLAVLLTGGVNASLAYGPAPGARFVPFSLPLDEAWALDPVGDLDGDGAPELLAGGGRYESDEDWAFVQRLVWVAGDTLTSEPIESLGAPRAVGPVDLNADGYDDLLLADGDARFWLGPINSAADITLASASGEFTGVPDELHADDLDGDGRDDFLGNGDDGVEVAYGPWSAATWEFAAAVDERVADRAVSAVAWNSTWLFATIQSEDWQPQVLGYRWPLPTTGLTDDAELRVLSPQPRARTGQKLLLADLDGDGADELVVASPGEAAPVDSEGVLRAYALP